MRPKTKKKAKAKPKRAAVVRAAAKPRPAPKHEPVKTVPAARRVAAVAPVAADERTSGLLLALIAFGLGLATLAIAAAAAPIRLLPRHAAALLEENRSALVLAGVACLAGVGVGLLIALARL